MLYFCTLFDSHYAAKGLAMYRSLVRVCPSFTLYVFAFDDLLASALKRMKLERIVVITLAEFEDPELLRVKPTRKPGEYCWTCTSSTILYCLEHYNIDHCTYLDSDLYFFSNPQVLIDEMGEDDVLITEHRYSPQYDVSEIYGRFCVQFVTFKNNPNALSILMKWREDCIEWCYDCFENGKMGDQMYLNSWLYEYYGVHVLQHIGGGVAPWNIQQYRFYRHGDFLEGEVIKTGDFFDVIFFHFHCLRVYHKGVFCEYRYPNYEISVNGVVNFYDEYVGELKKCRRILNRVDRRLKAKTVQSSSVSFSVMLKNYLISLVKKNTHQSYYIDW